MRRIWFSSALMLLSLFVVAQIDPSTRYPKGNFIWPTNAAPALVANFGELRNNHYHMGLDVRTDGRQNLPVYAAADGYIAKIKIEPLGFGRCIYINHPNGFTTLYAHLNDFNSEIEKYVQSRQYAVKKWKVFLEDIPAGLLKVKKGDFIAYSGNTGASQGPHIHFEIRDTKTDKVLNPSLFGFPIPDQVPPVLQKLAMYDRSTSTYEQSPRLFGLKKNGNVYTLSNSIISNANKVSFAIAAFDRYTGSNNPNGIFKASIYDNNKLYGSFEMDSISYDETRALNAHIDHKTKFQGGPLLEHLSRLPGNGFGVYKDLQNEGVIDLSDGATHDIRIEVMDANANKSVLNFKLEWNGQTLAHNVSPGILFKPGQLNVFENSSIRFYLPENYIYDSFHFVYKAIPAAGHTVHEINTPLVPIHSYFPISIKADKEFNDTSKIIMKRSYGGKQDFKKANWTNGMYTARFREFGRFELLEDLQAPIISALGFKEGMHLGHARLIRFAVSDNTEEIKTFNAWMDGQWLLFSNDKGKVFTYELDEHCGPGQHELHVEVEDLAGNKTEKRFTFTR